MSIKLTFVFVKVKEGGYAAYVKEIPGANAQGDTKEEARENLKEALALVLEVNRTLSEEENINESIEQEEVVLA